MTDPQGRAGIVQRDSGAGGKSPRTRTRQATRQFRSTPPSNRTLRSTAGSASRALSRSGGLQLPEAKRNITTQGPGQAFLSLLELESDIPSSLGELLGKAPLSAALGAGDFALPTELEANVPIVYPEKSRFPTSVVPSPSVRHPRHRDPKETLQVMADVDMTDAPGPSAGKKATDSASKKLDGKKRFEVKKVGWLRISLAYRQLGLTFPTPGPGRGPLGLGYRRGQLCHLPEPYYGSL